MLRSLLLTASASPRCKGFVEHSRLSRPVVARFVAGNDLDQAIAAARAVVTDRFASLDLLGEATVHRAAADRTAQSYVALVHRIGAEGLAGRVEVSVKLTALGLALPDGRGIALEHAREVCAAARDAGTTVTVDMEQYPYVDATLQTVRELRADFPDVGAVLQAYLRRTEADCRDLSGPSSRIRLCKGAYDEGASVAFRSRAQIDGSYRRCLRILMSGKGYPMVATHDPALITFAGELAEAYGRDRSEFEHQMLYGIRPRAQTTLAATGLRVRVYIPFGNAWYPYFMRRLGERPANLAFFLRSFAPGGRG
ncbi:proline dehydrogenase [Rhodococcus sp. D2-41]|uniref:proline dehydrogenase family protein n=1 Tax=Speluncibacter jeojiensis TaxID=2710754 RepID=UPI0024101922|nr:proline dehydrogenase family protein [Rhodococcus sp. D2-41]MDG3009698.1 proline dehydrogenase [Rhodococcus sp. D2-41]